MRLLIYGFGPYRHYQENVTELILRKLPKRRRLKKVLFPVKFQRAQFIKVIQQFNPDVIIGLGQCSGGSRLRIEARAVNKRRNDKNEKTRPIVSGGSRTLMTNLRLPIGRRAMSSKNAGDYVCNYSIYVILDFLKHRHRPIRFGFVHIPYRYDPRKAVRSLMRAIGKLEPDR